MCKERSAMREVKIRASKEYSVYISSGSSSFPSLLEKYKVKKCFVITDENVYNLHKDFIEIFKDIIVGIKVLKPGEDSKSFDVVLGIYEELLNKDVNKKTAILAFGGGVVGDIAGFVAATFMRGITLIHVPTTLMAQCDSSIGGKNGFNFKKYKNIIGTFYQPLFVYIDVNFLKTLNEKEYKNGIAEIIKYGTVYDAALFNFIEENKKGIEEKEIDKLLHIVCESAKIKGSIVEKDEFDSEMRHVLNFGHTIGHAIESLSNFKISHGEAVAIGMNIESYISVKQNLLDMKSYDRIVNIIKYFRLPILPEDIREDKIFEVMKKDKKNTTNNVRFVLPDRIGHAIITSEIKQGFITQNIDELLRR
jgi:3-dehydroquinate synthase